MKRTAIPVIFGTLLVFSWAAVEAPTTAAGTRLEPVD